MDNTVPSEVKFCKRCQQTQSLTEFYQSHSACKTCLKKSLQDRKMKQRSLENSLPLIDMPQHLTCKKCEQAKPIEKFVKSSSNRIGYASICKECYSFVRPRKNGKIKKSNQYISREDCSIKNKDRGSDWHAHLYVLRTYHITLEQYKEMLTEQNGVCAICNRPETTKNRNGKTRALAIDHDHRTGKVRGLLCIHCNRALGCLDDNPIYAENLLRYIHQHSPE